MKIKLFNLTWDLKPILFFLWAMLALALLSMSLVHASDDELIPALLYGLGCVIWSYINHTLANNGINKLALPQADQNKNSVYALKLNCLVIRKTGD